MELPDVGVHCGLKTCNTLDFLPYKCIECNEVFCQDHFLVDGHACPEAYKKDARIPTCPICSKPIPVSRGEDPNGRMNEHIASGCSSVASNASQNKAFSNRCNKTGCKTKELVPVRCSSCQLNFCFKHRFQSDHDCSRKPTAPGNAAYLRSKNNTKTTAYNTNTSKQQHKNTVPQTRNVLGSIGADLARERLTRREQQQKQGSSNPVINNGLSEDEALARALQESILENQGEARQQRKDSKEGCNIS